MTKIRITKEFHFEMAHALHNYKGPCKNIHGHSYKLNVTIIGIPIKEESSSDNGMVMDFGKLKKLINDSVINHFDHSLILNSQIPQNMLKEIQLFSNLLLVDYQPTCENIVLDIVERVIKILPPGVSLFSVKLNETESNFAEWFSTDNIT